ncbi:MAG: hypothetical protein AAF389_21175 [Gemmatimonadota bacterium]
MNDTTAREDLAWIRSLMDHSHRFLGGTWRHQAVWGLVGSLGMLSTYLAVRATRYELIPWLWVGAVGAGWFYSLVLAREHDRAPIVRNAASQAFGGIWISLGVTLTLIGGISIFTGALAPQALSGVVAALFGAGYFASGFVAGLRWLQAVAVAWWIGATVLLVWASPHGLLLLAVMTVVLAIGPALRLRQLEQEAPYPPTAD